jgi:hypothetical protein
MAFRPHSLLPLIAVVTFIVISDGCAPSRVFDRDGPVLEETYLPPITAFRDSEGRLPATKGELESFCGRRGVEMNPSFWRYVQMAPDGDTLVVLWHRGDDYVIQRLRWLDGDPKSEAIDLKEARRVLQRAARAHELSENTRQ